MAIASTTNQVPYTGDGVSVAFAYPSPFITAADIKVSVSGVLQSTGYTVTGTTDVTGNGAFVSGTVTFVSPPASGVPIILYCDPDQLQTSVLLPNDPLPAKTVEKMIDKVTLLIQRVRQTLSQALLVPLGETPSALPAAALRVNTFMTFDGSGNPAVMPIATSPSASSVGVSADAAGAAGNGTADDTVPMNVAISAAAVLGGDVLLTAGRNYKVTSSLVIPSNVRLRMNGATITWAGGASPVVTTALTGVTTNAGIEGGIIDGGTTCTAVVQLKSAFHCRLKDVTLKSNSATCTALELGVNTTGGTNADGNRNTVFCMFDNVLQDGVCGRALRTSGDAAAPTVVTDSTFINFNSRGVSIVGIDFASWTDSLNFAGFTRVQLVANNAIGVVWNSSSPTTNVGVYSNNFAHLAVDTFTGVLTGRVGIQMNWTKLNKLDYYFNDPPAEGGAYSFSANCQSYDVTHQVGLTSNLIRRLKLEYFGGKDNPIVLFGGGSEITTETVGLEVGLGRTGNGFAYVDLIGDTTFTNYGLRVIRNGAGSSQLLHQGASQLEIKAQTAGGSVGLTTSTGSKVLCNDTGIGFLAATPVAQSTGWGTPTGNAKVASFPGATATLAQTSAQLAQLIIDLKAFGLLGA